MQLIHSIKRTLAATAVGAITLGVVPWVMGDVKTFVPGSGNWHVAGNWSPSGVPTEADRVIIPEGKICSIADDAEADTIVVEVEAQLIIQGGQTLTLDNDDPHGSNDPDHSIVDGSVILQGEDAVLFIAENDHVVSGDGRVWGLHNDARIDIDDYITFGNFLATTGEGILGQLVSRGITDGAGTFSNFGIVHATGASGGILWVHPGIVAEDVTTSGLAKWMVTGKGLTLLFSTLATSLYGDFHTIGCGRLHVTDNVKTCGTFHWDGWLEVDASTYFAYVGFNGHSICSNPGISGSIFPPNCNDPYVVSGYFEQQCGPTACN